MQTLSTFDYLVTFTETYKKYQHADKAIREAECLSVIADYMYQPMQQDDLLAGRFNIAEIGFSSEPLLGRSVGFFYDPQRIGALLDSDTYTNEQKQTIREILAFWQQEETRKKIRDSYPEYMKHALPQDIYWEHSEVAFPLYRVVGVYMDYKKLLRVGLQGLKQEALEYLANASSDSEKSMYQAMSMAIDTLASVCLRYSRHALAQSQTGTPEFIQQRKQLAAALEAIATRPPQSFIEATQLSWLYSLASGALNYGRLDDYLAPFHQADLASGALTDADALAYLQSLWRLIAARKTVFHGRVIIGGKGRDNPQAADKLALLAIQATRTVHEIEPQLSLRFYKEQNPQLMQKALDCIGEGRTYPILYNDDVNIPSVMEAFRVSEEEATDYMMFGCGEYVLNHKSFGSPNGVINLLKALEATLFGGYDIFADKPTGLPSSGLAGFATFDELYTAYKRQLTYYIEILAQQQQLEYEIVAREGSFLYMSMLYEDCMSRGKAIFEGGIKYLGGTLETYGNINASNSLHAIKSIVYDKGLISRETLLAALKANFIGYEKERTLLLDADKYGNDLQEVDALAQDLHRFVCQTTMRQRERTSLHSYLVVIINNEANTVLGRFTAASPDGRRRGDPMANANNPVGGTDKNGVTAMLNSLTKLDTRIHAGAVQNMKFSRDLWNNHRDILQGLLAAYFQNGGAQAMITVLNKQDLENALAEPEKYKNLMVRVGGFSARFIELSPDVQQEILSRTLY